MGLPYKVFDLMTGAMKGYNLRSITKELSALDDGDFYVSIRSAAAVGNSSWIGMQINTPSSGTATIHMRYDVLNSAGSAQVFLFGITTGSTYYSGTTSITPVNKNRNSTNAATVVTKWTTAVESSLTSTMTSTQGTILESYYINSTASNMLRFDNYSEPNEWILKYNTTYIVHVINGGGAAGAANIRVSWYEE